MPTAVATAPAATLSPKQLGGAVLVSAVGGALLVATVGRATLVAQPIAGAALAYAPNVAPPSPSVAVVGSALVGTATAG